MLCKNCNKKKVHARSLCYTCYQRDELRRTAIYFQLKVWGIEIIIRRRFGTYNEYMRWYQRKNRKRINANARRLYHKKKFIS